LTIRAFCQSSVTVVPAIAILFGLIFRCVPAATPSDAALTALFFTVGKPPIELCLEKASVGPSYGAVGSVIVLIVWVHYSAQPLLFLEPSLRMPTPKTAWLLPTKTTTRHHAVQRFDCTA
jgi:uncharacterized BrkB/YihY/UPF0761 family membrane protein